MRNYLLFAALCALLISPGVASAHKKSASKAAVALTKAIDRLDATEVSTGVVTVSDCKPTPHRRGHRHQFKCRVVVQQVFPDGSHELCTDSAVKVRWRAGKFRRVRSSYLNAGGFSCDPRVGPPAPPEVTPVDPADPVDPVPTTDTPPPPDDGEVPTGPPTDYPLPDFPDLPTASADSSGTDGARSLSASAAAATASGLAHTSSNDGPFYFFREWSNFFQIPQYPGYYFIRDTWDWEYGNGGTCNSPSATYFRYWWWGNGQWNYWFQTWLVVVAYSPYDYSYVYREPCS